MNTKETSFLQVLGDYSFDEKTVRIHPNDGFDLGVMTTDIVVKIYAGNSLDELEDPNTRFVYGNLYLENNTRMGTCELALKTVQKLGSPKRVRLHLLDGEEYPKLLISTS
ncbi:MAG: hypothetical protein ACOC47_04200 [Alkalispirochaetaceae bacterium]